jgi:hypothetical protein
VFRSFGVDWVVSEPVVELLFGWHNSLGKISSDIWNLVPLCLMWTVWHERNRRTFEDVAKYEQQLLDCFASSLFEWSSALVFTSINFVLEFVASLYLSPIFRNYMMFFVLMLYAHLDISLSNKISLFPIQKRKERKTSRSIFTTILLDKVSTLVSLCNLHDQRDNLKAMEQPTNCTI